MTIRPTKKYHGIALVSIMMATLLCMMMLGAFLQSNRNYLQLLQRGQSQDTVKDATRSLYEFARSSLEKNKGWGTPFASDRNDQFTDALNWTEHKKESSLDREGVVTGVLANGLVFRLDVLNNMRTNAVVDNVRPKSARVEIRVYENSSGLNHRELLKHSERFVFAGGAQALLRNDALFDSGIVASTGIELHGTHIGVYSKDPVRNQIRSNAAIKLPDADGTGANFDFGFLEEVTPGNWQAYTPRGYDGTVWAKDDILLGNDVTTNAAKLALASRATNAHFIPDAQTRYSIPELSSDDIQTTANTKNLQSGIYIFSNHWVTWGDNDANKEQIPVLLRVSELDTDSDNNGSPDLNLDEFYYIEGSLGGASHTDTKLLSGNLPGGAPVPGVNFSPKKASHGEDVFELPDAGGGFTGLTVDLKTRSMNIEPGLTVEVDGNFVVSSSDSDYSKYNHEKPVHLNFGAPGPDDPTTRSSIKATGTVVIEGFVKGKGNIIAEKSVALLPNSVALDSDDDTDLAIYAGENVAIVAPSNSGGAGKASFRGLIYAEKNFHFEQDLDLEVEGAVVARQGHVYMVAGHSTSENDSLSDIVATRNLKVTYNPNYLDDLLRPEALERTKVELLAWRPISAK